MRFEGDMSAGLEVELVASGEAGVEEMMHFLGARGIRIAESAPLRLVLTEDLAQPGLLDVHHEAVSRNQPWLLVQPSSTSGAFVGPLFHPAKAGCWPCLRRRLEVNGWNGGMWTQDTRRLKGACDLAARWAEKFLRTHRAGRRPRFAELDGVGSILCWHSVTGWSGCTECPRRTVAAPATPAGLVSGLSGLLAEIRTYRIGRHFVLAHGQCSRSVYTWPDGRRVPGRRMEVSGKGTTLTEARRHCIWEGVERASLVYQGGEPLIRASLRQLGEAAIDPRSILLFSNAQYRKAVAGESFREGFHKVPQPLDRETVAEWTPVQSAGSGAVRYVLAEMCYLGYGGRYAWADTNGCAAGETRDHAALTAFAELIERDAVAIWWYNRLRRPAAGREASGHPRAEECARILRRLHRDWWLLDITSDFGVAVYAAVSCDATGKRIALGSAAGADPRHAAARALSEMTSHAWELTYAESTRREQDGHEGSYDSLWTWWRSACLDGHSHLTPASSGVGDGRRPTRPEPSFEGWTKRARRLGLEVYWKDHTRPEIGTPVVRVLAPGLRHWWPRFAPGRLYSVPVKMGWRTAPLRQDQLNAVPYFL